jgi:hypothetical protein
MRAFLFFARALSGTGRYRQAAIFHSDQKYLLINDKNDKRILDGF